MSLIQYKAFQAMSEAKSKTLTHKTEVSARWSEARLKSWAQDDTNTKVFQPAAEGSCSSQKLYYPMTYKNLSLYDS